MSTYRHYFKETLRNGLWIVSGKVSIFILGFAFITGMGNLVPKDIIGSYTYVMSILSILGITTLIGMNQALVRAVSRGYEGSIRSMMRLKLIFGSLGSLLSLIIGIYYLWVGIPMLGYTFLVAAPFVPMTDTWSEMAYAFFQGRKDFKKSILLAFLCQALFSLPSLAVLFFTHNLIIICGSFFIFQAIGGIIVYTMVHPKNTLDDPESRIIGFHLTASSIPRIISQSVDVLIVWQLLGPLAVAVYTFAITPFNKLEQLLPFEQLTLPDLSRIIPTREIRTRLFLKVLLMAAFMIPIILIGILISPYFFSIIFPKFPDSVVLFQILLVILITKPFTVFKTSFTAWSNNKELYISEIIFSLIKIISLVVFGLLYGIQGIVIGAVIARCIEAIMLSVLFIKIRD